MTKLDRCLRCGRALPERTGPGRPRKYCSQVCRQRDFEARQRAAEVGLSDSELVMARSELDALRDALYVVEAAVEDVERDLNEAGDDPVEVRRSLDWLLDAVRPLLALRP